MTSPKNAFFVLSALVALAIAAGIGIFYMFDGQLASLNQDIGKLLAEQEAITSQINIYADASKKIEELSFVGDLADEVLPQSKEQANLVAELKKFILDAGLQFDSVSFDGAAPISNLEISQTIEQPDLSGVRILPVTAIVQAGATYPQVISLLEAIENSQRKMQLTNIALTPEDSTNVFSSITMQIDVYVRTDSPASAAAKTETETGLE